MSCPEIYGFVTDFKHFAVHDGDGIRTTVFLKGCPLRCQWCHNPESMGYSPELAFFAERCVGCGACQTVCPAGVHQLGADGHRIDRTVCLACGKCTDACAFGALRIYGRRMSVEQVMETVRQDSIFYESGNGGMTLSGGEPTAQPEFALALLQAAKAEGIRTALDTCGHAPRQVFEAMLPYVDTFLFDVKHIAPEAHRRGTGVDNRRILDNLAFLSDRGADIEIRLPLIPGFNDDPETLRAIGELLAPRMLRCVRLLPYHDYARGKYQSLGKDAPLPGLLPPDPAHLKACADVLSGTGLLVKVG